VTLDGKIFSQEQPHSELNAMDALPKPTIQAFRRMGGC
jgi:hypothetical protein